MGSVPSDLDKNKVTEMEECDNDNNGPSRTSGPSSSSPPRIEEMEEDDDPTSKTAVPSSSPPRIKEMGDDPTSKTVAPSSSPPPRIKEMEDDPTSKTVAPSSSPPTIDDLPKPPKAKVMLSSSSPPTNEEEVDHPLSDSVNVTDMPMEGPQEIEQEEEKDVEPQEDEKDNPVSPPTPTAHDDHDHTYSTIDSTNDNDFTKDNIQACPVVMETSEHINIPEHLPESTIEIGTSSTDPRPPSPPAPPPEVDHEQVAHLQNEVTRLEALLTLERNSKQELSTQLLQSQTQFTQLSNQLTEAASIIIEQQKAVNTVGEKEALLESLQGDLLKEREEKSTLSQKYEKQHSSLVSLTKEFNEIFEELQTHFASCCKPKQQNEMDPSNMSWMSNQQLQNKLDQLTSTVQERFQFWTNEQRKMEEELSSTRKTMEELIELLEEMEETSPQEHSSLSGTTVPPPPQSKIEPPSSPPPPPEEIEHGEDHSKKTSKRYCLCGREFFSGGSLHCHIKRFTGEQKYVCGVCSKGFVYPSDLKSHKLQHKRQVTTQNKATPPKKKRTIWSCEFCNNSFFKADIYKSHRKTCGTVTAGPSSADSSPPPIFVASSSYIASHSPPANIQDSSDDDITILEDDSTFTPSISIPLRQPQSGPPSQPSFPPVMSRVAQLYMSSSPISILPTPPPPPLPPGIVKVVQHTPIPTTPMTSTSSFTSKKHSRDITKRHIGFFCICGIKFISRKRLDGHLTFRNGRINGATNHRNWNPLTLAQIKKEKATSSSSSTQGQNFKKLKSISKRGGGRAKSKKKHGVEPTDSLKCLCGQSAKSVGRLLSHIRYHTATKTIPCEFCDKLFLTNSFLNRHYKMSHQVEMMTAASYQSATGAKSSKVLNGLMTNGAQKISKPGKPKKKTAPSNAEAGTSIPPVQVHRLDYSKSHRGNFCKCGRKFSSKRKLNIHLYRKNTETEEDGGGGGDTENSDSWRKKQGNSKGAAAGVEAVVVTGGIPKFTCNTCGENFPSNSDRISHRVQVHGHGLF